MITNTDFSNADLSFIKDWITVYEIDLDKFDTHPDELDYTTLADKIDEIIWEHRGPDAHLAFINYAIENEKLVAHFYYINSRFIFISY